MLAGAHLRLRGPQALSALSSVPRSLRRRRRAPRGSSTKASAFVRAAWRARSLPWPTMRRPPRGIRRDSLAARISAASSNTTVPLPRRMGGPAVRRSRSRPRPQLLPAAFRQAGPAAPTAAASLGRQDQGVLSQFGATLGQSVGEYLVVGSTLKLMRAGGETHGDLDLGAMATLGAARFGVVVKNATAPAFGAGGDRLELGRQVRTGVRLMSAPPRWHADAVTVAVNEDGNLRRRPTACGGRPRDVAGSLQGRPPSWVERQHTRCPGRLSQSVGASLAVRSGLYVGGQATAGADRSQKGWGFDLRVTF